MAGARARTRLGTSQEPGRAPHALSFASANKNAGSISKLAFLQSVTFLWQWPGGGDFRGALQPFSFITA